MADIYYPYLSELVTIDQLPDGLSFISDDSNEIFSKIRYQNFVAEHSVNGGSIGQFLKKIKRPEVKYLVFEIADNNYLFYKLKS